MNKLKNFLLPGTKTIISIGSLYIVFRSISWPELDKTLSQANYFIALIALTIFWLAQIISALRCVYIARVLGGSLKLTTSLRAHFVGLWFNQVMPTGLGGDIVKMAILREPLGLNLAIRSTILDRVSGLFFLLLSIAVTLPLYSAIFSPNYKLTIALSIISIGGITAISLFALAAQKLTLRTTKRSTITKLLQLFSDILSFRAWKPLKEQLWTSAIVHFNGIITYALLGLALGVQVNWGTFLLVVPVVFLIALIPISFAGWGLREAGAIWLFGIVGISSTSALAMSVSFGLLLVIAGLPGVVILLTRRTSGDGSLEEPSEEKVGAGTSC